MNCRRAEELFSDYRDRALAPPLERAVSAHFETCNECRELYRTFEEVTGALGALTVPAPPVELTEKLSLPARIAPAKQPFPSPSPRVVAGASWLAVAAVLAMMLLFRPPELVSDFSRTASRAARHVYSFTVRSYNLTERWIEDLNVLRMTVGVAFEDRLDQINEQLRDLEDAGRRSNDENEQSRENRGLEGEPKVGSGPRERVGILSNHSSRSFS